MHLFSLFATIADNEWIHVGLLSSSQLSHFIEVDSLNILAKKKRIPLLREKAGSGSDKSCFFEL